MKLLRGFAFLVAAFLAGSVGTLMAQVDDTADDLAPEAEISMSVDETIPDSPLVTTGRLENGLRYIIRPQTSPTQALSLRLVVNAGSLHEDDDEQGFAHFVEHMAFNGTKNFPAGELFKFLQRQGVQHGPHINAHTSPVGTVYKLDLPDSSAASLETGLRIFRDFSDGILFEPAEIRRERGVIFSEHRVRNTPQLAEYMAVNELLYGGTRVVSRYPIGLPGLIEHATRDSLRRFYDAWYRPERMSVVIVGKVAPAEAETLVASHFASLTARAPARPEPAIGALETFSAPKIAVYPNNRAGMEIRAISIVERPASQPWTWEEYLSNLYLRSALAMLEQRFRALTSQPDRIVGDVSTSSQFELLRYRRSTLTLTCSNKNFPAVLALLEQELRRAIELGFSSEEISREQELFRRRQAEAAASLPTRSVSLIAGATVDQIQDSSPLRLPGEPHEQLERYLAEIDSRKCQDALRAAFAPDRLHLFVSSQRNDAPTAAAVREIYEASTRVAVSSLEHSTEKPFAYDDFGPAGAIVEKIHVVDLDIWQLRLSNGVRVNLKRTPYDAGHLQFIARVGYGRLSEPADKPGLGSWLPFWFYGGTQQHTARENLRFLGGLGNIALTAEEDASSIKGRLPAGNLPLALRQITALFSDPAFRKEGWETTRGILRGYTHTLWSKPQGAVARFILPALAGGDPRAGTIHERQYLARTIDEFQAWFTPQLADSPIEFSLVGDFDPELAMTELTRTLGTLPARKPRDHTPYNTQLTFPEKLRYTRYSYVGTAERPSRVAFYWTFHDTPSLRERRLLRMLAAIFKDRLDDEVREKQGASYTPGSDLFSSETYPGFNYLTAWIDVKSSDARKQSRALQALADKLAKRGITADELARAKAVVITGNNRNRSLNTYWLEGVLASSQQRPERLDAVRSFDSDVNTATIAEMNALAARYYGASKLFKVVIDPSAIMPKKK